MKTIKNLACAALAATLLFQTPITRSGEEVTKGADNEKGRRSREIDHRFVILLSGVYHPVPLGQGPRGNLGLNMADLSDGSFSKVNFYPISGLPGDKHQERAIGTFYVQFTGMLCAYDLPGGSITAMFTGTNDVVTSYKTSADGSWTLDGTFELDILEATGRYRSFVGGHIHMVDILKFRAGDGTNLEDCYCHIHPKLLAP